MHFAMLFLDMLSLLALSKAKNVLFYFQYFIPIHRSAVHAIADQISRIRVVVGADPRGPTPRRPRPPKL